jgi:hypothetical protein
VVLTDAGRWPCPGRYASEARCLGRPRPRRCTRGCRRGAVTSPIAAPETGRQVEV